MTSTGRGPVRPAFDAPGLSRPIKIRIASRCSSSFSRARRVCPLAKSLHCALVAFLRDLGGREEDARKTLLRSKPVYPPLYTSFKMDGFAALPGHSCADKPGTLAPTSCTALRFGGCGRINMTELQHKAFALYRARFWGVACHNQSTTHYPAPAAPPLFLHHCRGAAQDAEQRPQRAARAQSGARQTRTMDLRKINRYPTVANRDQSLRQFRHRRHTAQKTRATAAVGARQVADGRALGDRVRWSAGNRQAPC